MLSRFDAIIAVNPSAEIIGCQKTILVLELVGRFNRATQSLFCPRLLLAEAENDKTSQL